jgi:CubicO group peptidase (beta-lactamase class C family)
MTSHINPRPKYPIAFFIVPRQSLLMRSIAFLVATATALLTPQLASAQIRPEVRVIFNAKRITNIHAVGMADPAINRAVTVDDPVRIASISKLYVALGVMRLVDAGKLDLDRDVSDYLGWKLRNPAFPDAKITLRLLLSHQSSVSDNADYLIPVDETIRAKMADPKAWDAAHAPGSGWFTYTNLNFPIIASVMEAATGERFDRLIDRTVMKPLKLSACFNWSPCTAEDAKRAVVLFRSTGEVARDDLKGALPPCPGVPGKGGACDLSGYTPGWNGGIFSPQGGLRISARDLVKTGQMMMRGGKGFLKRKTYLAMITPQWLYDGANGATEGGFFCTYALAVQFLGRLPTQCKDEPFGDGGIRYGHSGEAYGLKSGLWVYPYGKTGMVYFTTAVPEDAPKGKTAFYAVEEALIAKPVRTGPIKARR